MKMLLAIFIVFSIGMLTAQILHDKISALTQKNIFAFLERDAQNKKIISEPSVTVTASILGLIVAIDFDSGIMDIVFQSTYEKNKEYSVRIVFDAKTLFAKEVYSYVDGIADSYEKISLQAASFAPNRYASIRFESDTDGGFRAKEVIAFERDFTHM